MGKNLIEIIERKHILIMLILFIRCTAPQQFEVETVLEMSTHNEALYAYYYTDNANTTNTAQVTEIFDFDDVTKQEMGTDMQSYKGSIENQPVVSDWNCIESGKLINQLKAELGNWLIN